MHACTVCVTVSQNVTALPTGSSLSTIPRMLKSNHGIQDDRLR